MIFVLSATGQVGKATVDALLEQGVASSQVIGGARDPSKAAALTARGVQIRQADYRDATGLKAAFTGARTLILIPTMTPPAARCVEHDNALTAAKAAGVEHVVFLSLQAATPQSLFSIAPFILFAECATRISGMHWTLARMGLYTDPVAQWLPELVKTQRLPYPVTNARIAYVTRADVGRGLAAIASDRTSQGKIFELTGPAAVSMPELAELMSRAAATPIHFATVTDDEFRDICRKANEPDEVTEILVSMYHAAEAQEFSNVSSDLESLTGRRPESVAEVLARFTLTKPKR